MIIKVIISYTFRYILLWLFVFDLGLSVRAQEYTKFNFQQGIWLEEEYEKMDHSLYRQSYCENDTIINDHQFYKLFESTISLYEPGLYPDTVLHKYLGAIRENESKQVFFKGIYDSIPEIIYDFNLQLGDTFRLWSTNNIVSSIDSIEVCGKVRKSYTISNPNMLETLVEGIGFSNGLLGYEKVPSSGEYYNRLACYTEQNNSSCSDCSLILGQKNYTSSLVLSPNPVHDILNLQSVKNISSIKIFNLLGTVLHSENNLNSHFCFVNLVELQPDLYIVRIQYLDNSITSSIILKY